GMSALFGLAIPLETLALRVARRGKRSQIGWNGYGSGGLLFERGAASPIERVETPTQWRVLLIMPAVLPDRVSGHVEAVRFDALREGNVQVSDVLTELAERHILPACRSEDFDSFAEAVSRFNRESGLLYAGVQGGPYNGRFVSQLIESLQRQGAVGLGQSSWGPCVFVFCENDTTADQVIMSLDRVSLRVMKTQPRNAAREWLSG
ncbi:MAG: hypothetical protein AAGJ83_16340, partial [Planctomycetota bacterium]